MVHEGIKDHQCKICDKKFGESVHLKKHVKTTCRIFLGFQFLVRNEEKNGIPHEETRKFRGIFLL